MAEFNFSGLEEITLDMQQVAQLPDEIIDAMLNAKADVTAAAQKSVGRMMGVERTGLTLRSIKKGKIKLKKGQRIIYVTATGSRKRGEKRVRNAEIAFLNEFGTRKIKARPFIRTANEQSAEAATAAAMNIYDEWLESHNL